MQAHRTKKGHPSVPLCPFGLPASLEVIVLVILLIVLLVVVLIVILVIVLTVSAVLAAVRLVGAVVELIVIVVLIIIVGHGISLLIIFSYRSSMSEKDGKYAPRIWYFLPTKADVQLSQSRNSLTIKITAASTIITGARKDNTEKIRLPTQITATMTRMTRSQLGIRNLL